MHLSFYWHAYCSITYHHALIFRQPPRKRYTFAILGNAIVDLSGTNGKDPNSPRIVRSSDDFSTQAFIPVTPSFADRMLTLGEKVFKKVSRFKSRDRASMSEEEWREGLDDICRYFVNEAAKLAPMFLSLLLTQITVERYDPARTFDMKDIG